MEKVFVWFERFIDTNQNVLPDKYWCNVRLGSNSNCLLQLKIIEDFSKTFLFNILIFTGIYSRLILGRFSFYIILSTAVEMKRCNIQWDSYNFGIERRQPDLSYNFKQSNEHKMQPLCGGTISKMCFMLLLKLFAPSQNRMNIKLN